MSKLDGNIVKKTGLYFIGNFASKIIMAIMIPFYAYFVSVEELGVFDYSQTIMNTISPIIFLALWESILRFLVAEKDDEKRTSVIATSIRIVQVIITILLTTSVIIFTISNNKVVLYTMLMTCFYGAAQIWQYYARALKYNQIYIFSSVIGTILNFLMLIATICIFKMGGTGLFWSYIIGQISIVILIELKIRLYKYLIVGNFDWNILKQMLIFSVPLVLNLASSWLISGFGRIIITNQLGAFDNGLYSFATKFGTVVSMLGSVISMALIEEAIIKSEENEIDEYFSGIIQNVFILFLSICIVAVPFIAIFYTFISHTEYSQSYNLVPMFLLFALLTTMSTNVGAIFQAKSKTNILFYTTVYGAVITVVFSLLMVNVLGIQGVAIAQILGALTMLVSRWVFAGRFIKFVVSWYKIIILSFIFILVVIACSKGINIIGSVLSVLAIFYALYTNKEVLVGIKGYRKGRRQSQTSLPQ